MVTNIAEAPSAPRMVDLLDPTGEVARQEVPRAKRRDSLAGATLGLLDNSMGFSHVVLDTLGAILRERYGVAAMVRAERPNLSRPTPAAILDDLVARSDVLVTGCGV